jgi:hypothetical protein
MAQVTELITKFSFEGSTSPLSKFNAGLGKSIGLLAGVGAAAAGASATIAKWASNTLAAEQPLINLAAKTGIAVERLQELQFIAEVNNSSAEALSSSMEGLAAKIGEAATKGNDDFSRLGISVRDANGHVKSTDRLFAEIGNRFKTLGLSLSEQQSFAEALGIDSTLLQTMSLTSGAMSELSKKARDLGTLNEDQIKQAQDYNDSLTTLRFGMSGIQRVIAVGLVPEMKELADSFTNLLIENKDWIINGIKGAITVLSEFMALLERVWPVLAVGVGIFVALKVAALGSAVLIAAGIAAIIVVVDDLITAFQGGKSVIADFFKDSFGVDIVGMISGIWSALVSAFDRIKNDFKHMIRALLGILPDKLLRFFGVGDEKEISTKLITTNDFDPNDLPTVADPSFMPGGRNNSSSNRSSRVEQNVKMEIRTTDPVKAGRVAADSLQSQMIDAQYQAARGGM